MIIIIVRRRGRSIELITKRTPRKAITRLAHFSTCLYLIPAPGCRTTTYVQHCCTYSRAQQESQEAKPAGLVSKGNEHCCLPFIARETAVPSHLTLSSTLRVEVAERVPTRSGVQPYRVLHHVQHLFQGGWTSHGRTTTFRQTMITSRELIHR